MYEGMKKRYHLVWAAGCGKVVDKGRGMASLGLCTILSLSLGSFSLVLIPP